MKGVLLVATAMVDRRTLLGPRTTECWNPDGSLQAPDPRRFFPALERPSRLDLPSRFVLAAGGLLPPIPEEVRDATAVVLGSPTGCLAVDRDFARTLGDRPQPALYARTLPTTPGAELSRALSLRGMGLAVVQQASPGFQALLAAWQEVASGACEAAIAGEYQVPPEDGGDPFVVLVLLQALSPQGPGRPIAFRFLGTTHSQPARDLRVLADAFRAPAPWRGEASLEGGQWEVDLAAEPASSAATGEP